ncbi:KTSC domain-containing protein [Comamonas sp. Sa2CVA6]|uniref:KTSC domain-containing protein n=1 Tax=Comamonas avium TaxID=2762231 RepID=A0ABR8SF53_9BURK|nr:KTSC domain-containing protein [Comamonas avium]
MEIRNLNSSAIRRAGYSAESRTLTIWFTSDPALGYDYYGVPAHIWQGLISTSSAGTYFHLHIEKQYGR